MKPATASIVGIVLVLAVLIFGIWAYQNNVFVTPTGTSQTPVTQIPLTPAPTTPTTPTQPQSGAITVRIGESGIVAGITISPIDLLEDSRCPTDVTCIQAGTVRMRAAVADAGGTATYEFRLGNTITTARETIQLVGVTPESISTVTKVPSNYRFTFQVTNR